MDASERVSTPSPLHPFAFNLQQFAMFLSARFFAITAALFAVVANATPVDLAGRIRREVRPRSFVLTISNH
jgi:hypothetical protein